MEVVTYFVIIFAQPKCNVFSATSHERCVGETLGEIIIFIQVFFIRVFRRFFTLSCVLPVSLIG